MLLDLFSFFLYFMNKQHIGKPLFLKKRKKMLCIGKSQSMLNYQV